MKSWIAACAFLTVLVTLLAVPSSIPALSATASVEGVVVPDVVHDKQPFSFSVPQAAQEQVNIASVSGVVVQQTSTDKYGRIFLATGLAAGSYLLSAGGKQVGKIEIQPRAVEVPMQHAIQLTNPPQALRVDQVTPLSGHGFDPNCANMKVSLKGAGGPQEPVVLAATEDQLKLAPVPQLTPGAAKLTVTNQTTSQTYGPQILLAYKMDGHLQKTHLTTGGDRTQLVVDAMPHDLPLMVRATVASGPVDFGAGRRTIDVLAQDGQAIISISTEHGTGPFQVVFALSPDQQITAHDQCRCSLRSGRCIPTEDYYCEETKTGGKWSCISTKD